MPEFNNLSSSVKDNLKFDYDVMGNRVAKYVMQGQTEFPKHVTFYVRDASGNVMAVYEHDLEIPESYYLSERHIYGSSRIGMVTKKVELNYTYSNNSSVAIDQEPLAVLDRVDVVFTTSLGYKQYELTNHLGNVLAVIGDQKLPVLQGGVVVSFEAHVISSQDYSPFGVTLSGRSWSEGYRYGFQNQETDEEIWGGAINYKYRIEDPRLGRFFSVDPLYRQFPWNSNYAFSENRVIDGIELEGLERISIHNYAFAPFDDFGGGFHGDGANRCFGDDVNPGDKLKEGFRIGSKVTLNLVGAPDVMKDVYGSWSLWTGDEDFSEATFESFQISNGALNYHYSGGNAEPVGILQPFVADIDVKLDIVFKQMTGNENKFQISGMVKGDRFPSNETYLTDIAGNKLFLGASGPDGMFPESLGPVTELNGSGNERMHEFNFFILFNDDDSFKGVSLGNGKWYDIKDWNKLFTDLIPSDSKTGTNITKDGIQTNYDPD